MLTDLLPKLLNVGFAYSMSGEVSYKPRAHRLYTDYMCRQVASTIHLSWVTMNKLGIYPMYIPLCTMYISRQT